MNSGFQKGNFVVGSVSRLIRLQLIYKLQSHDCNNHWFRMKASRNIRSSYDVVIVGGGIVGVATGRQLKKEYPDMHVALLEKENQLGLHQTGRNSGVIHAGVYYPPGSVRAKLCVRGCDMIYEYLRERGIAHKQCGKVIVAREEGELKRLDELFRRARANEVRGVRMIERQELRELEPACEGLRAIHSPHTGIVNFREVTESMAEEFRQMGGDIVLGREVLGFGKRTVLTKEGKIRTGQVIVCGGSQADRLAGVRDMRIVPVRGEYHKLSPEKAKRIRGNIYPVPDPKLPFLGVHFTPRMDGGVWVGPNAVLALSREGDTLGSFNITDMRELFSYPGLYRLGVKHWRFALSSILRSLNLVQPIDMATLKSYITDLVARDIERVYKGSGVRALLLDRGGNIVEDFYFGGRGDNIIHVINTPSPGATSSLALAEMIIETARKRFDW